MMRAVPNGNGFSIGPSLCAGLTLRHYSAFAKCASLKKVDERYDNELMDYKTHGIHVLLSQNNHGELTIGDSHHYGRTMEPFDEEHIDAVILKYLHSFTSMDYRITERWHGIYPKIQGNIDLVMEPQPGVVIVNGLGGAGMTLSFGLAEEVTNRFL
jgi:glycine/D-amino acid oxidase-like deaminating enzyme